MFSKCLPSSVIPALLVAWTIVSTPVHAAQPVRSTVKFGIDNLIDLDFQPLKNKRIALVANIASRTRTLDETAQVLASTDELQLCALLTPEHGYFAQVPAGESVSGEIIYGIPTYSLYGKTRRPTRAMIGNCDAVVLDLQDIGLRPYTFISTMYNVMDACAEYNIPIYVLDRPNPLGGQCVDGNLVDEESRSFVSIVPVPYIHGLTIGELALMMNEEGWLPKDDNGHARKCRLTVVKMKRWHRTMSWEALNSVWIPTSPNIPSINAIRGMALTGLVGELSLFSIGIGTTLPFQYLGQPQFRVDHLDSTLRVLDSLNIHAVQTKFVPTNGKFAGQNCTGLLFNFDNNAPLPLYSAAVEIMIRLRHSYAEYFADTLCKSPKQGIFSKIAGSSRLFSALTNPRSTDADIRSIASAGLKEFSLKREKYLLYR